jgi:hypothetical protein
MSGFNLPTNFMENPESLVGRVPPQFVPAMNLLERRSSPIFIAMAQKDKS